MELRSEGYSAGNCLDFDQACATFWNLIVLHGREERVKGKMRSEDKLGKNETWHPKYKNDQDLISKLYYAEDLKSVPLDPVVAGMSPEEMEDLMETWDPYAEPDA